MEKLGILYRGVNPDETFMAYKDVERVIEIQVEAGLIEVVAEMNPRVVVMGEILDNNNISMV